MSPERWRHIEQLYLDLQDLTAEERELLLSKADPSVAARVRQMLHHEAGEQILDTPAEDLMPRSIEMNIGTGSKIGPYTVEGVLGSGGMGTVYRASDTRLGRKVAIKLASAEFSTRFARESRAIAALNHPHICTLYDIGPNYLVMELVEGESLAARLAKGPLPLADVLSYGWQVALALGEAHGKGIIHRDLKPGNIMLTPKGVLKLLDFGLAKSVHDAKSSAVLGTPGYMAPERLEGQEADARSDIYALGLVLVEMATGKRIAHGQSPEVPNAPAGFAHVVERCLRPNPDERWHSAVDIAHELDWVVKEPPPLAQGLRSRRTFLVASGATAATGAAGYFLGSSQKSKSDGAAARVSIPIPDEVISSGLAFPVISPDGSALAASFRTQEGDMVFVRRLDSDHFVRLEGTAGGVRPFWSPDSRHLGFFAENKVKRIPAVGGSAIVLCSQTNARGGTWSTSGKILFSVNNREILQVPASGGEPTGASRFEPAQGENSHRNPVALPDGNLFLYHCRNDNPEKRGLYLESLDRKEPKRKILVADEQVAFGRDPRSGVYYLLTRQTSKLVAQAFSVRTGELAGEPSILLNNPGTVAASDTGVLVFQAAENLLRRLMLHDRRGTELKAIDKPRDYWHVAFSKDGSSASFIDHDNAGRFRLNTADLNSGAEERVLDSEFVTAGIWSHDNRTIYYTDLRKRKVLARTGGNERTVVDYSNDRSEVAVHIEAVSREERYLVFASIKEPPMGELVVFDTATGQRRTVAPIDEACGACFSPDSKWLAFGHKQNAIAELYVTDFPGLIDRHRISAKGGVQPRWPGEGKELFYVAGDGWVTVVPVNTSRGFHAGAPTRLFRPRLRSDIQGPMYDVSPDGQRFLVPIPTTASETGQIEVIFNWPALLRS